MSANAGWKFCETWNRNDGVILCEPSSVHNTQNRACVHVLA